MMTATMGTLLMKKSLLGIKRQDDLKMRHQVRCLSYFLHLQVMKLVCFQVFHDQMR